MQDIATPFVSSGPNYGTHLYYKFDLSVLTKSVSASAVLKECDTLAGLSVEELSAQKTSRVKGLEGDSAGHISVICLFLTWN